MNALRWIMLALIGITLVGCSTFGSFLTVDGCTMQIWNQEIDALHLPPFPVRNHTGDEHTLIGIVRDQVTCAPVANATVMFDLTNAAGEYDGTQQGTVYTNDAGFFLIHTNRPGEYGGGPPHIHLFAGAGGYVPITIGYNLNGDQSSGWVNITLRRAD